MTTLLRLYNAALRHVGERKLASTSENVESRHVLDEAYLGFVDYVLAKGYWKFAQRVSKISYSPNVTVDFGYPKAYLKPTDFIRVHKLCSDEYLKTPLLEYSEEAGYWYGHNDDIYLSYISNDASYGSDLTAWTPTFVVYAELALAGRVAERLTPAGDTEQLMRKIQTALDDASSKDALEGPTEFFPPSGWSRARGRSDRRNSRSELTGGSY